jgi:hypothetical protein
MPAADSVSAARSRLRRTPMVDMAARSSLAATKPARGCVLSAESPACRPAPVLAVS